MAEGGFVKDGGNCLKYLKRVRTEKGEEKTEILKRRGQSGSRGGYLKKEGRGAGTLLRTEADLSHLVYKEICSKFYFKIHTSFLGRTQKNS